MGCCAEPRHLKLDMVCLGRGIIIRAMSYGPSAHLRDLTSRGETGGNGIRIVESAMLMMMWNQKLRLSVTMWWGGIRAVCYGVRPLGLMGS